MGNRGKRHLRPILRGDIDLRECCPVAAELRLNFEDDLVLIGRGIDCRDLPLAKGVIEGLIDQRGGQAEPVSRIAINIDRHRRRSILLVRGDVLQLGQFAHLGFDDRRPVVELGVVGVGQRVLVLRPAEAPADRDVLRHLHVENRALYRLYLLAQPLHNLISGIVARVERLKREKDPGRVLGGVISIGSGEHEDAADTRIVAHDIDDLVSYFDRFQKRRVLPNIDFAENGAGVLLREEPLRDFHIEAAGCHHQQQGSDERGELMAEDEIEPAVVRPDHSFEEALGPAVETALGVQPLLLQEQRAHDRRQGQRHDRRGHHGDRHGDREFAEQSADHAAHRKERDEHRDQRKGDRDDREADLAGSLERGFERGHPLLDIADDVLDHDDRIVHDEPHRDR